jgi:hypothetical protein
MCSQRKPEPLPTPPPPPPAPAEKVVAASEDPTKKKKPNLLGISALKIPMPTTVQ